MWPATVPIGGSVRVFGSFPAVPTTIPYILASTSPLQIPFGPSCSTGLPCCILLPDAMVWMVWLANPNGQLTWDIAMPNDASLVGTSIWVQSLVLDVNTSAVTACLSYVRAPTEIQVTP